jgi:hypothetical protein
MTDAPSPRYRDYLTEFSAPSQAPPSAPDPAYQDSTVVMKMRDGSWRAIWQGPSAVLGEFTGSRQDSIAWARQRSRRCWVYSEERGDVVLLDDTDHD